MRHYWHLFPNFHFLWEYWNYTIVNTVVSESTVFNISETYIWIQRQRWNPTYSHESCSVVHEAREVWLPVYDIWRIFHVTFLHCVALYSLYSQVLDIR